MRVPLEYIAEQGVNPDGSEPIGWLAGIYTLGLFILVALLLWSFVRTMRRARQMWQEDGEQQPKQGHGTDRRLPQDPPTQRRRDGIVQPDVADQD